MDFLVFFNRPRSDEGAIVEARLANFGTAVGAPILLTDPRRMPRSILFEGPFAGSADYALRAGFQGIRVRNAGKSSLTEC